MKEVHKEQLERQRKGLLALVHLAKKDLGLSEEIYRSALAAYGVGSAAAMSIPELKDLVRHFESCGFERKVIRERRKTDRTRR
ncbi:phage protein GemA/Gp16 family protein [Desulfatiglans anilini]|uniref:phage protein GemA/Gp16 family protein n=1 Tax=Desulfatiglans anilini TaxID=90728 RepID=UPI00041BBAD4|nr:phage protein GemA/Gp16 family protein [Desulfatiglans anilini]